MNRYESMLPKDLTGDRPIDVAWKAIIATDEPSLQQIDMAVFLAKGMMMTAREPISAEGKYACAKLVGLLYAASDDVSCGRPVSLPKTAIEFEAAEVRQSPRLTENPDIMAILAMGPSGRGNAIEGSDPEAVKMLIAAGADVSHRGFGIRNGGGAIDSILSAGPGGRDEGGEIKR